MKSEKEKMLSGETYYCGDRELLEEWHLAKKLIKEYNHAPSDDRRLLDGVLTDLLGHKGENVWITAPFFCDFGKNISIGKNTQINHNCVFLDCNRITIGENVLIAPSVQLYAAFHPTRFEDRLAEQDGKPYLKTQSAPITIGNNVWIGGGTVVLPGVTIGDNTTIGAGSVVTKSIPSGVLAYGNPCRVIRKL